MSDSNTFLSARGTFYQVQISDRQGPGVYAVENLGSLFEGESSGSPILIHGITLDQNDIVSAVPCLNNVKVFYTFGQQFGQVMIEGELLLGALGDMNYDGYNRLLNYYKTNRVSSRKLPVKVSVAKNPYFVYLIGIRIGKADPEFHSIPFILVGTLLDLESTIIGRLNTASVVFSGDLSEDTSSLSAALSVRDPEPPEITSTTATPDKTTTNKEAEGPKALELTPGGTVKDADAGIIRKEIANIPKTSDEEKLKAYRGKEGKYSISTPAGNPMGDPSQFMTLPKYNAIPTTPNIPTTPTVTTSPNYRINTPFGVNNGTYSVTDLKKTIENTNAGNTSK